MKMHKAAPIRTAAIVGVIATLLGPFPAIGCVLDREYSKTPLEQRIAEANIVFLGHVDAIECEDSRPFECQTVVIVKDDILLGDKEPRLSVGQGHGPDCQITFYTGEKLFFSGTGLLSGTTDLKYGIPPDLAAVIEKFRQGIPLQHRILSPDELAISFGIDTLFYDRVFQSIPTEPGTRPPNLFSYSDKYLAEYDDKTLLHLLAWHDYWRFKRNFEKLRETDEKIARGNPDLVSAKLLPLLDQQELGWAGLSTPGPHNSRDLFQSSADAEQVLAKDNPDNVLVLESLSQGYSLLALSMIRDGDFKQAMPILQLGRAATEKTLALHGESNGLRTIELLRDWFENAARYVAQKISDGGSSNSTTPK